MLRVDLNGFFLEPRIASRRVIPSFAFLVLTAIVTPSLCRQQNPGSSQAKEEEPRLESVLALKNRALPGEIPTYYTTGYEKRAKYIQDFLVGERDFYQKELGIAVPLTVAVLDAKQWEQLNILDPYGVPTVSDIPPYIALMPANWNESSLGMLPPASDADPRLVKQVQAARVGWSDTFYRGFDTIIGHEYGHPAATTYGIGKPKHWLDEFLATYFLVAYVHHKHPELEFPMKFFFAINRDYAHPFTSLDDFETRYPISDTSPTNYGWYQASFEARIEEVYSLKGIDFLKQMKLAFPAKSGAVVVSNAEILRKLDQICPGFTTWAHSLEATPSSK
jgi:hypothetical protein